MIPGPYSICHATFPEFDSDCASYRTLKWGYDSAKAAFDAIQAIANENGVPADECGVIRNIDSVEAENFTS
jgi:hypothetical protein